MDFNKENDTYTKANLVRNDQHAVGHAVWQTQGSHVHTYYQSDSDGEPVVIDVVGDADFFSHLRNLPDIGPDIAIDIETSEPSEHMDESG